MLNSLFRQKTVRRLLTIAILLIVIYGSGRIYFRVTGGFVESNISYDMPSDARWTTIPLTSTEKYSLHQILSQSFYYLGKGCQSYVFASADDQYVIKFFKYQRFRPQAWLKNFAFIPMIDDYRLRKIEKKKCKLDNVYSSWKLAYEELRPETGVIYVHLNKSAEIVQTLTIYDKIGLKHELDLTKVEFMIQKKVDMLCPTLLKYKDNDDLPAAKKVVDSLFTMLLSEYQRGYADNDHALMQNTGVDNGQPYHIDVGQFVKNPMVKNKQMQNQELFNKTWKFRIWLRENYPELSLYIEQQLQEIIGEEFGKMRPTFDKSSMGRIPNHH